MHPDPFQDSLSKLGDRYQVLTELHHCADSRTYLARNLELNRDVTITVARANGDKAFLNAYAADAEQLKTKRHPNIIPVLEAMWLDDATFAVVRARVRGSTLDQALSAEGPMPQARIAAALSELTSALIWARENGITNRCVEAETFVFQQGSGRLLLAFEPSHLIAGDAETIEAFARMMNGGASMDVSQYTAQLGAPPVTSTPSAAVVGAAAMMAASTLPDRPVTAPVGKGAAVVERPHRGMGFMARVLTAFVVIAAVIVGALWFMQHRRGEAQLQANAQRASQQDASGDVSPQTALDTAAAYSSMTPTVPPPPPPNVDSIGRENEKRIAQAKAEQATQSASGAYVSPYGSPSSLYPAAPSPSTTMSNRPPATTRPTSAPPADSLTLPRTDSAGRPELLDPCGSPIGSDQGQCLNSAIYRADRSVNGVYQKLIAALRRQAGASPADPDPSSVEDLRALQQNWIHDRDDACKSVGEGSAFYARERGSCYAERSSARKAELQRQLDSIP